MLQALAAIMTVGCVLALLYAAGVAIYGRRDLDLYVGPIAIGLGVALICAATAVLLTYQHTLASLICAIIALGAGNITWLLGERRWREAKRRVMPLARAIHEAERQKQATQDSAHRLSDQ